MDLGRPLKITTAFCVPNVLLIPPRAHSYHNDFTSAPRGTRRSRQGSPGAAVSGTGPQISARSGPPGLLWPLILFILSKDAFFGARVPDPAFGPERVTRMAMAAYIVDSVKNVFFGPRLPDPTFRPEAGCQDWYGRLYCSLIEKSSCSGFGYRTPHFGPERVTRIAMAAYIVYYVQMPVPDLGYRTPHTQDGPQDGPRRPPEGPKMAQDSP